MIPLKLELRNFLSYGEDHPALTLEGIRVACLSGPNGHGKSALLDAMVWALWGEPRGGARAGDDLVRHGAREMEVALEFELHGVRHRVTRRRTLRAKTGTTDLQLETWDGSAWRTYTGGSLTETQRAINGLLHMTHETFVHASFIAQGKADAFMTLTPQQRKQVLGEILDLGQYDELAAAARDASRRARAEAERLATLIAGIDAELARREEYQRQVDEATRTEHEATVHHDRLAGERARLLEEVERLRGIQREADEKERAWRRASERVASLEGQLRDLLGRVDEASRLVERADAIEAEYARYTALETEERELAERFEPWRLTREEMQAAEATIERQRIQLTAELDGLRRQAAEAERRLRGAETAVGALATLTAQLAAFDELDRQLIAARDECEAARNQLAVLQQEGERLKVGLAQVQQRVDLLGTHEECPLCGQVLGADGLHAARARLTEEQATIESQLAATRAEYKRHQIAARSGEERQRTLQEQLTGRARVERALGDAQAQARAAEQDRALLDEIRANITAIEQQLAAADFASEARAAREAAAARLATIAYDPEHHRKVRAARDGLRAAPETMRKLDAARVTLSTAASHRADLETQRDTARADATALSAELNVLREQAGQLPAAQAELASKERELQSAGIALRQASQLLGEARQMLAWLAGQERERETLARSQVAARQEEGAYAQLADAFGKNGIQEMLVDHALPDIQDQANELLARLSGGRMRVELSTQRAGRTGGTISTLDVNVADELGTRPYELFSGGERFRINFAIRIALSRYLATRAGAPLQMLAIDEGFGSQDREGCDRMIEAIRSIEDDFERVLVITHLEEMKDVFPVRIEVTKTAKGSTFSVT